MCAASKTSTRSTAASRASRGRPRLGASQLSRSRIVEAALELIDAQGLPAVSMRSVAQILGVDAKSLYNHVDGKEGLLDAVADHILSTVELPPRTDAFEEDLRSIARAFRRHALRHPNATLLVLTRPTESIGSLAPLERILSLLVGAGCSHELAVHLLRLLMATMLGSVLRDASFEPRSTNTSWDVLTQRAEQMASSGLRHVVAATPYLISFDSEVEFEFSLNLAIAAIVSQLPKRKSPRRKPT